MKITFKKEVSVFDLHKEDILIQGGVYSLDGQACILAQVNATNGYDAQFNFIELASGNRLNENEDGEVISYRTFQVEEGRRIRPVKIPEFAKRVTHLLAVNIEDIIKGI